MLDRRGLAATLATVAIAGGATAEVSPAAEQVTIVRDSRAEPHIRAKSAAGAFYGFAYAQMEDQAAYILGNLARSTGRSAELQGPACLPLCFLQDQLTHLFRIPETATSRFGTLPRGSRSRLRAFAKGINAYVDEHRSELPPWAAHVTGRDVLASVQWPFVLAQATDVAFGSDSAGGGRTLDDVLRTPQAAVQLPASNGFVLDGSRTASGRPLLQGNPHLPFDGNQRWYAAQLSYPGHRVQGVTFRGLPGIAIGSNGHVAWTNTANNSTENETDRYIEKLNPANPNQYRFGSEHRPMTVRDVVIQVQRVAGVVTPVKVRLRYTVHGPVVSDPPAGADGTQAAPRTDVATSVTVSQFEQVGLAPQLYAESEARNLSEYRQALRQNQLSGFNILAADRREIFYAGASRSGILREGLNSGQPLDGSDPTTAWQGILPFERLPQATDPPSGFYQNANNAPWFSAPDQIRQADQPFFLRGGGNGTRSRRQTQLLAAARGVSIADAERIGLDTYVEFAPSLKALLSQAAAGPGGDARVKTAASLIGAWDNRASRDSTAYPLFATWRRGLRDAALGFDPVNPPAPSRTFTAAQRAEASRAMIVAHDGMKAQYGTIAKRYGDLHTYSYGSLRAPVDGGDFDLGTLHLTNCRGQAGATSPVFYGPCAVRGGSSFIFNVDMASGRMTVMRPVSNSDDSSSPRYTDNAADYVAGRFREFPVSRRVTARERTSRLVLRIRGPGRRH